jgi:hypothetical protein
VPRSVANCFVNGKKSDFNSEVHLCSLSGWKILLMIYVASGAFCIMHVRRGNSW